MELNEKAKRETIIKHVREGQAKTTAIKYPAGALKKEI